PCRYNVTVTRHEQKEARHHFESPDSVLCAIFRALTASGCMESRVFYTWSQAVTASIHDPGFGQVIRLDLPLPEAARISRGVAAGQPASISRNGVNLLDTRERVWGAFDDGNASPLMA